MIIFTQFLIGYYKREDRKENIRRITEVSKLFIIGGAILNNCFISPIEVIRNQVKEIIREKDFFEIYVNTLLEICEQRDVKGFYAKARAGIIKSFPDIDYPL